MNELSKKPTLPIHDISSSSFQHLMLELDIEKTTQSLNNILAYKKELALNMLRCSDEEQMKILAEAIKYSDDMIRNLLGMYVP